VSGGDLSYVRHVPSRYENDPLRLPVVAVSGWGQDNDRRRSREAGFDHHLVKPVNHEALMALVSALQASVRRE
jgi:DNA-binding response OmpR family regulator